MAKTTTKANRRTAQATRQYVSQADIPAYSLEQALRVATTISEHYSAKPVTPLQLASGMMMTPTSGQFRQLCGASIAYGLTEGGYNADRVSLTPLGRRLVRPLIEGDELAAQREATLKPRVLREFLQRYDGSPLPRTDIASNVLVEMGVPEDRVESIYRLILDSAQAVGFIREIKGKQFADLSESQTAKDESVSANCADDKPQSHEVGLSSAAIPIVTNSRATERDASSMNKRVFVTHGKNRAFVDPIKKLLGFGEMIPVVSVENQSVSKPVPDKVMDDMRSCGAAIIHVDSELALMDKDAQEHVVINPNVLIEVGAAMALFGRRFILLVRDGVRLPSNLQGLFEVRYSGATLDGDATIRLLEAINDIKNHPLPKRDANSTVHDLPTE